MNVARLLSFCLMACCFQTANAQQTKATPPRVGFRAVVDLEKIKSQHQRYQSLLEELGQDEAAAEAEFEKRQQGIDGLKQRRKTLSPLSHEAVVLMNKIITEQAQLEFHQESSAAELQQRRAKIERALYEELVSEITYFARRHRIDVVLNYRTPDADEEMSLEEARTLFQRDVAFQKKIDITDAILLGVIPRRRPDPIIPHQFPR